MTSKSKLLVFAKAPLSGEAKTRLSPPLTAIEAATLAETFLLDTLEMVGTIKLNTDIIIYYTPITAANYFTHLIPGSWQMKPQQGRSLKMKITNAFRIEIGNSYQPVIIIGTDSPTLPPQYLTEAFKIISKVDLVIGPALDGGFYLIGMNKFYPELLKPVTLSKPESCEKLVESAVRMELTFKMLPAWYDIDRFEDFKHINNQISDKYGFAAPRTKTLLAGLAYQQADQN
ncbi:MAG: TIGR04282 family arsenosugar biosynthesis glycosyltransferase [Dethiobacteria bacterium]